MYVSVKRDHSFLNSKFQGSAKEREAREQRLQDHRCGKTFDGGDIANHDDNNDNNDSDYGGRDDIDARTEIGWQCRHARTSKDGYVERRQWFAVTMRESSTRGWVRSRRSRRKQCGSCGDGDVR